MNGDRKVYAKDIVYTPEHVAKTIVKHFKPSGKCLDPCMGDGVFYNLLPVGSEWCEIAKGRDFFEWDTPVDWIVGNPPYTIFSEWLRHSMTLADNIVYLIPINKAFNSYPMMKDIANYGSVAEILVIQDGKKLKFNFGYAAGAVLFKRGYRDGTITSFLKEN